MHHKFVVIDGRLLVTGSFNWTRQAIMGNRENLIVTDLPELVSSYLSEFEQLWNLFDPKVLYSVSDAAVSAS
jgi:mitochondrial cardiolipin hydrolase